MQFNNPATLLAHADRCVMCGLCSPRCPTYLKTRHEAESPRGRVALINAAVNGQLGITARLQSHLDSCLSCRACEPVCPSGVEVSALVDQARAAINADRRRTPRQRLTDRALSHPRWLRLSGRALRAAERSGLRAALRHVGALRAIGLDVADRRLPRIPAQQHLHSFYAANGTERGRIALFRGCATGLFDTATLLDAIQILNSLGIGVHVPADQVCCGALHQHSGAATITNSMAHKNIDAFALPDVDAIVGIASGCTAMLADYDEIGTNSPGSGSFAGKVIDINRYLIQSEWPAAIAFKPLQQRVAIHVPCSQAFGLGDTTSTFSLLAKIPGVDLVALPGNDICCGAAGSHMLTHAPMADTLLADKLAGLTKIAPDVLVTSNIGCALHFRHGLKQAGLDVEVMHPIALLRRQLR